MRDWQLRSLPKVIHTMRGTHFVDTFFSPRISTRVISRAKNTREDRKNIVGSGRVYANDEQDTTTVSKDRVQSLCQTGQSMRQSKLFST